MREATQSRALAIPVGGEVLEADLTVPPASRGLVLFAHGSGSGRYSPRNRAVAAALERHGFATLLLDLLTAEEALEDEVTGALRFDVEWLAGRLGGAMDWMARQPEARGLPFGIFGASTGAAAALYAAAEHPELTGAVVSRGGRPDLAAPVLGRVAAPTLLIVGGADTVVLDLNRRAFARLHAPKELEVVPGATHLFEEPGALEQVAALAAAWFERHLGAALPRAEHPR